MSYLQKKILYIDMDGVIADFAKAIGNLSPGIVINTHNPLVVQLCEENPEIFHTLEPIEGSIDFVNRLFKYYDVYFLSTPMWNVPLSFTGKRLWLEEHFGKVAEKRLILTHRKDLCIGDYLIDDTTRNGAGDFIGVHLHYNTARFPDWHSMYIYLINEDCVKRQLIN